MKTDIDWGGDFIVAFCAAAASGAIADRQKNWPPPVIHGMQVAPVDNVSMRR